MPKARASGVDWRSRTRPFPVLIVTQSEFEKPAEIVRIAPSAIELRLDTIRDVSTKEKLAFVSRIRRAGVSVLATARRKRDGGSWPDRGERKRAQELLWVAKNCDAVDVEDDLAELARQLVRSEGRPVVILSMHSFDRAVAPKELDKLAEKAAAFSVSRLKVAVMLKRVDDVFQLAEWATRTSKSVIPVTAIAMGGVGAWTRWELPKLLGGPAYAPLGNAVAPGQISYAELLARINAGS